MKSFSSPKLDWHSVQMCLPPPQMPAPNLGIQMCVIVNNVSCGECVTYLTNVDVEPKARQLGFHLRIELRMNSISETT